MFFFIELQKYFAGFIIEEKKNSTRFYNKKFRNLELTMLTKSKIDEKRIFDIVPFVNHYMHTNIPSLIILHDN